MRSRKLVQLSNGFGGNASHQSKGVYRSSHDCSGSNDTAFSQGNSAQDNSPRRKPYVVVDYYSFRTGRSFANSVPIVIHDEYFIPDQTMVANHNLAGASDADTLIDYDMVNNG